jgi:hypothetical protein
VLARSSSLAYIMAFLGYQGVPTQPAAFSGALASGGLFGSSHQPPAGARKRNAPTKDHAADVIPTPVADAAWDHLTTIDQLTYASLFQPTSSSGGLLSGSPASVTTLDRLAEIIQLSRKAVPRRSDVPQQVPIHSSTGLCHPQFLPQQLQMPGVVAASIGGASSGGKSTTAAAKESVTILSVIGEYASGFADCLQAAIQQTTEPIILLRSEQPSAGEPESDAAAEARGASELQQAMAGYPSVLFFVVHCTPPNVTSASDRIALMNSSAYLRGQLRLVAQLEATLSKSERRHQQTRREVEPQQQHQRCLSIRHWSAVSPPPMVPAPVTSGSQAILMGTLQQVQQQQLHTALQQQQTLHAQSIQAQVHHWGQQQQQLAREHAQTQFLQGLQPQQQPMSFFGASPQAMSSGFVTSSAAPFANSEFSAFGAAPAAPAGIFNVSSTPQLAGFGFGASATPTVSSSSSSSFTFSTSAAPAAAFTPTSAPSIPHPTTELARRLAEVETEAHSALERVGAGLQSLKSLHAVVVLAFHASPSCKAAPRLGFDDEKEFFALQTAAAAQQRLREAAAAADDSTPITSAPQASSPFRSWSAAFVESVRQEFQQRCRETSRQQAIREVAERIIQRSGLTSTQQEALDLLVALRSICVKLDAASAFDSLLNDLKSMHGLDLPTPHPNVVQQNFLGQMRGREVRPIGSSDDAAAADELRRRFYEDREYRLPTPASGSFSSSSSNLPSERPWYTEASVSELLADDMWQPNATDPHAVTSSSSDLTSPWSARCYAAMDLALPQEMIASGLQGSKQTVSLCIDMQKECRWLCRLSSDAILVPVCFVVSASTSPASASTSPWCPI